MIAIRDIVSITEMQVRNFWGTGFHETNHALVDDAFSRAMDETEMSLASQNNRYYEQCGFDIMNSVMYTLFLYRLSRQFSLESHQNCYKTADQCYYLNKILHSVDWYHEVNLPVFFGAEHPAGSVMGRARYGEHLFVYQGTTVGGSVNSLGTIDYPTIGDYVILFANASVLGNSMIGNNVVIGANVSIINKDIPDNCVVKKGGGNELIIRRMTEDEIKKRFFSLFWLQ